MKKTVVLILVILCIIVGIIFIKFNNYKMKQDEINKFNSFYENYNKDGLNGLDTTYKMERITNLGMESFIAYFGEVGFKCTDIKYHEKTGRVASMTFEATNY